MPDLETFTWLLLGFLLGARHALDADHLAAVATLVSTRPNLRASGLVGMSWGIGHTATLLAVGLVVLFLGLTIPTRIGQAFEFLVGMMLVTLGVWLASAIVRGRWHVHRHEHEGTTHLHLHSHQDHGGHGHTHWLALSGKPVLVGMVHGLAGSAAVMLVVVSATRSIVEAILYILVFGAGSILGMALLGVLIALPLAYSASIGRRCLVTLQGVSSLVSVGLGLAMMLGVSRGVP